MKAQFDNGTFNHIRNEYKTVIGNGQAIFTACFIQKIYAEIVILVPVLFPGVLSLLVATQLWTFNMIKPSFYRNIRNVSLLLCAEIQSFRYSFKDSVPS